MRRKTIILTAAAAIMLGGGGVIAWAAMPVIPATPPLTHAENKTLSSFNMVAIDGAPMPLSKYAGKVVLLVNTASFCGFTPQYEGLQKLQTDYAAKGFTVIGVPSGDFLNQEYKSNKEISGFCKSKFGINFPLAEKGDVVGPKALPVYRWAAAVLGPDNTPRWNFHKYLVGRDGKLISAFGTKTTPNDPAVTSAIEAALKAPAKKA